MRAYPQPLPEGRGEAKGEIRLVRLVVLVVLAALVVLGNKQRNTMTTTLLFVGKTTDAHIEALCQEYLKRLTHYLPVKVQVIPELRNTKALTPEQQKQAEGELILRAVTPSTELILLDEHGKEYRSVEFAQVMQKKMSAGRDVVFAIGGPYGFSEAVYERANGKISLSQMTFSHQMVRLFLIEQIYRAMTILRGEPYHHE